MLEGNVLYDDGRQERLVGIYKKMQNIGKYPSRLRIDLKTNCIGPPLKLIVLLDGAEDGM